MSPVLWFMFLFVDIILIACNTFLSLVKSFPIFLLVSIVVNAISGSRDYLTATERKQIRHTTRIPEPVTGKMDNNLGEQEGPARPQVTNNQARSEWNNQQAAGLSPL